MIELEQMRQTKLAEKVEQKFDSFFENEFFSGINFDHRSIAVAENSLPLKEVSETQAETFPDKFLKAVKFIFFFIPGVFILNLTGPILFLSILYDEIFDPFVRILGTVLIGTFLTLLGMWKLNDLNYLKSSGCSLVIFDGGRIFIFAHRFVFRF